MTAELDPVDFLKNGLAAEVVRSFGKLRLRVVGSSMLPAIWPDDILLIHHCDIAEAALGDIVLFMRQRRLYAHRVAALLVPRSATPRGVLTRLHALRPGAGL